MLRAKAPHSSHTFLFAQTTLLNDVFLCRQTHTHKLPWTAGTPSNSHPHSDQYSNHRKPFKQPRTRSDSTTGKATHYLLTHPLAHLLATMCLAYLSFSTLFTQYLFSYHLLFVLQDREAGESRLNYSHNTIVLFNLHIDA